MQSVTNNLHLFFDMSLRVGDTASCIGMLAKAKSNGVIDISAACNINNREPRTLLYRTAFFGNAEVCKALIEAGVDVNVGSGTEGMPLHIVAAIGQSDIVAMLLTAGANPDARDARGQTPLWRAATEGCTSICHQLLDAGADINASVDGGFTPLHSAAVEGHLDVCKALLRAGARVSGLSPKMAQFGYTAFQEALKKGRAEVVSHFLDVCGEDLDQVALNGQTLWQLAKKSDKAYGMGMVRLLNSARTAREIRFAISGADSVSAEPRAPSIGPI